MQAPNASTGNTAGREGNSAGREGNTAGREGDAGRGGSSAGREGYAGGRGGSSAGRGGSSAGRGGSAAGRTCQGARCCCTCNTTDIVVAAARACYSAAPGSGTDGSSSNRGRLIRPHMFALRVPFPSPLEAQIAHGSLAPDGEPHRGVINKQLMVRGNVLAIKWTSEDARLLRISIINCLEQLSLVLRTMQLFGPPIPR
ncbi:L antigen family member 3 [Ictidomys tridecemlineatus]|uniref:EKC/KEOPS complex subunit LAGE3 n=1 Tax=Ictidomys tridecemlineatus TaxID=43179 RepID=UPI00038BED1A|nr:EKC/KEOPS complex subunit LAGE3 [Ictidomys tridecemlineatus]KAG3273243.1 L antigen family member 3 [Ictidomys tridecemlineatus]